MANNKVQLRDGTVLLDLTGDTVTPETLAAGVTAHDAAGNQISGAMVVGGCTIPKAAEIRKSWIPIDLDADSATDERWSVAVGDKQIRAGTFMGAMISLQNDYIVLPIIMSSDGTDVWAELAVPLINSAGQCALADVMVSAFNGYIEEIDVLVQETFDLSDPTSELLYDPILYMRPNPT